MWMFKQYAARLHGARSSTPKVMNNTTVRWLDPEARDTVVIRHFNTDLFKVNCSGLVTILCAYDSVTSKRRFRELAGISLYRPFRGLELAFSGNWWRAENVVPPCPALPGTMVRERSNAELLAHARYWLTQVPSPRSHFAKAMQSYVDKWEGPYETLDTHTGLYEHSGLCLVSKATGCYERLLTKEDVVLKGIEPTLETQVTVDGSVYIIEPAEDYARGARL